MGVRGKGGERACLGWITPDAELVSSRVTPGRMLGCDHKRSGKRSVMGMIDMAGECQSCV